MINEPNTRDLLTEARELLIDDLVPGLDGDKKYQALMIANAIGMAIRDVEQHARGEVDICDRELSVFLENHGLRDIPSNGEQTLANALRERHIDGTGTDLRTLLRSLTEARLRINNPDYLNAP